MKSTGYLLQAALISLWWIGLSISDEYYNAFQFPEIGTKAFNSFFLPDILIVAALSVIRAYRPLKSLELIILGGFAYGTLYCINASILTHGGYLAMTVMTIGLAYNMFLVFSRHLFKPSRSNSIALNALKTLIQIVCVWTITLVLFPWLITAAFGQMFTPQSGVFLVISLVAFAMFSLLGLTSAVVIVRNGNGTPLPLDQTTQLVTTGPYRFVRNPMAIAGVGQGLSVSLIFGSIPILVYSILGALLWHLVVKPIEERDMLERFGEQYEQYRRDVSCWIPIKRKTSHNKG